MKRLPALLLWLFALACTNLNAQCPITYTYTLNSGGTVTTAYNLTGGKSLKLTNNTTYTGTLTTDATSIICIDAGSTFNPGGYYYGSGYYNNAGTINFANLNNTNGNMQWVNSGTITVSNSIAAGNAVTINNATGSTINLNGLQTNAVATITNAGTISNSGYALLAAGSTFTNSGIFTSSAQFEMVTTTLTNTGQFNLNNTSNAAKSGSTFLNKATMYINFISFNTGSVYITNDTDAVMTFGATVMQLQNSSAFTNYGTLNFQKGFELDNSAVFTNNSDVQMNNTGSTFVNNGNFNNYGNVYVNGTYTSNSSSTTYNYCTITATSGMTIQGNANNYGYMLLPTNGVSANNGSPLFLVNGSTFTNNGLVQGTNFTNTAKVTGYGKFYFTGNTDVENDFTGTSSTQKLHFYDASRNPTLPLSSGYNYFDQGWGNVSNTDGAVVTPVSVNAKASSCNALVIAASQNTECASISDTTTSNSLLPNGDFSLAVTSPASGNTYSTGAGTSYIFSGGSFKSQADYNGTSCARNNTNGNGFSIVSAPYTGSGSCANINQYAFPGDAAYGVPATTKMLYIAGNLVGGSEYIAYQQTATGLTVGSYYTFYFYTSNMREPANASDQPYIRIRVGGTDGMPDGKLGFGPYILDETSTQNSAALNGWVRMAYTFKATATSMYLKVTDGSYKSSNGDDWAITAAGIAGCTCKVTPSIIVNCSNGSNAVSLFEANGSTWYWTTATAGRFYTSAAYSDATDSTTSHLQNPYIKAYGSYTVAITDNYGCVGAGSITVLASCGSVLATNLIDFTATKQGSKAYLSWQASAGFDNAYFDIERSTDGVNFIKTGTVTANAGSAAAASYSFTDASPAGGLNYYRLKQVTTDGKYYYSETRSLSFTGISSLRVYPNPATDHLTINFDNDRDENAQLTVIDANGRPVIAKQQALVNGNNSFTVYFTNNMASGLYLLKINTTGNVYSTKFIKGR